MDRKVLKSNAKRQLGGSIFNEKWMLALVICLISNAILSVVSGIGSVFSGGTSINHLFEMAQNGAYDVEMVVSVFPSFFAGTGVSSVLVLVISGPLAYGLAKAFLHVVYGEERPNVATLFDGFKDDFGGTLLLGLMQTIFIALWTLLFIIPGIIKSYSYAMAFFIKVDHPDYDWSTCLKESDSMMKGHKGELFVLDLSFIGWIIVAMFTLGIGLFWVSPYMECTRANFYACLAAQSERAAASQPADPFVPTDEDAPQD